MNGAYLLIAAGLLGSFAFFSSQQGKVNSQVGTRPGGVVAGSTKLQPAKGNELATFGAG